MKSVLIEEGREPGFPGPPSPTGHLADWNGRDLRYRSGGAALEGAAARPGRAEAMAEQKIGLITHYFGKIGVAA